MSIKAFVLLLFCSKLRAKTLDQTYLQKLRSAKTAAQINEVQAEHENFGRNERICGYQLKQDVVPWACYARLHLELKWQLIEDTQAHDRESKLNDRCKRAAQSALRGNGETLGIPKQDLSVECRREVEQAREISRYRSDEIFSQRAGADFEDTTSP